MGRNAERHYEQVAKAIEFVSLHRNQQPSLAEIAAALGMSEFHLQRLFTEWVGLSPKQFLSYLTKENAKSCLRKQSVMSAAIESGLSGSSRLHDLMIQCEGMTPGQYKSFGVGIDICFGFHLSPFGQCGIAATQRGICKLAFIDEEEARRRFVHELEQEWPRANLIQGEHETSKLMRRIFPIQANELGSKPAPLKVLLKGTEFQMKVWEGLLSIPEGELCSYQSLADRMDMASSVRAVASAVARNNVAYLIPCHRVIRACGSFNQYRWGAVRKQAMLGWELGQNSSTSPERC